MVYQRVDELQIRIRTNNLLYYTTIPTEITYGAECEMSYH